MSGVHAYASFRHNVAKRELPNADQRYYIMVICLLAVAKVVQSIQPEQRHLLLELDECLKKGLLKVFQAAPYDSI